MNKRTNLVISGYWFILRFFLGKERVDIIRHNTAVKRRANKIRGYGINVLKIFSDIAEKENVFFCPFWGTLLGFYREHDFIKHDDDIDIAMFDDDITISLVDRMLDSGFTILHAVVDKDLTGGFHLAFEYDEIKFDIYSLSRKNKSGKITAFCPLPYNNAKWRQATRNDIYDILHVYFEEWNSVSKILIKGIYLPIPSNTEEILQILYGSDFMTPIPNKKTEDTMNPLKVHEDSRKKYACLMNYEVFKMFKNNGLL